MSSQTVCVCVWGGDLKRQKCFPVPCSTLPYNHSMEICPIWKYGARSADAETPQDSWARSRSRNLLGTKTKTGRYISWRQSRVCVFSSSFPFPILGGSVFAPRSNLIWEKLCLHGIRIYYSNWGELFRRTWGSVCSSLPAVKSFVANIDQHLNEAACLHSHHLSLEVPIRKIGWYFKSWWMEDMCFHGEMFEWFWSHYSK